MELDSVAECIFKSQTCPTDFWLGSLSILVGPGRKESLNGDLGPHVQITQISKRSWWWRLRGTLCGMKNSYSGSMTLVADSEKSECGFTVHQRQPMAFEEGLSSWIMDLIIGKELLKLGHSFLQSLGCSLFGARLNLLLYFHFSPSTPTVRLRSSFILWCRR